ncbi:transposase [Mesorhizobium sp.]|uniref:IS66 family transposase n=1 Tax=Mesorhizobium sp. TaxID=1871066 RepID=UPI0011F7EF49|nr:MAG: hypothetical protein E5W95_32100 [Mesorhizobium sp.]
MARQDCRGEHPAAHLAGWSGILQADAFGGYGDLYATGRQLAPVLEASCWTHSRRKVCSSWPMSKRRRAKGARRANLVYPLAVEAVKRIDAPVRHRARDQVSGENGKLTPERNEELNPLFREEESMMREVSIATCWGKSSAERLPRAAAP